MKNAFEGALAIFTWVVMFLVQLVGILLGIFIVPIMLMFGKTDESSAIPFSQFNTHRMWKREVFPKIFYYWDNLEDSSAGDHRGWWDANCFFGDSSLWINRFWWLAIRNPFNNFKRYVIGCDVRDYHFTKIAGQDVVRDDIYNTGWQFLKATPREGGRIVIPRYMFYLVGRYGTSERALVIQIGNKIKLEHEHAVEKDEYDYFKGFTTEINAYKYIG